MTEPTSTLKFGNRTGNNLRQTVKRIVPTAANDKFVQVSLKPLVPLILATSALVYHEGQQKKIAEEGNTEAKSSWQGVVTESTLGYLLLKYTSGVYPLLGFGLAVARASKEDNALDQFKAVINTVMTMGMGFLGANIMDPDLMAQMENGKIKKLLECGADKAQQAHLKTWIKDLTESKIETPEDENHLKAMGEHLADLKKKLLDELPDLEKSKDRGAAEKLKKVHEEISELKSSLAERISAAGEKALEKAPSEMEHLAQGLLERLADSQSAMTKMTRVVNPICCFMASAFLLGTPISNWINRKLEHRHPELKKKAMKQVLFPDSQRVLKPAGDSGALKANDGHEYRNPGPSISCPDVANGRPMQY